MLASVVERTTDPTDRRFVVALMGLPKSGKSVVRNMLYTKLNQQFVQIPTNYYIAMELARDIITKQGNDPDLYWEDTAMQLQHILAVPEQYQPQLTELEFLINKDEPNGVIGALFNDTDYKYNIVDAVKEQKEYDFLKTHNTIFVVVAANKEVRQQRFGDGQFYDHHQPSILIGTDTYVINNDGTIQDLEKDVDTFIKHLKNKFQI